MTPRDSALAALGLRRGAARAEVDEAYRRLIKLHHPDRTGGDGLRAAEINRAYTLLRAESGRPPPRTPPVVMPVRQPPRRGRSALLPTVFIFALLCGAVGGTAIISDKKVSRRIAAIRWPALEEAAAGNAITLSFDQPLNDGVIDSAIADAITFRNDSGLAEASAYSRDCQKSLRTEPSLARFDVCAAFDEATAMLRNGDAGLEEGPFSDSEVMSRELSAARLLSDDSLAADSRIHQIRSKVEMKLLPALDTAAAEKP